MTTHVRSHRRRLAATTLGLVLPAVLLAACASEPEGGSTDGDAAPAATEDAAATSDAVEAAAPSPRLAVTYDGGIQILDATTLEVVDDIELPGFNRVNPAGDGRHVVVSTTGGFQLLDAGTWAVAHGDHAHYYTAPPVLTDVTYPAATPGHVVVHEGRTALFDDATGHVVVTDSAELAEGAVEREHTTPSAHHGVAVELADGTLVVSEGTEDARTGVRVLDADDTEIAASDDCPGIHGEAVAADEIVVVGCEDGALVVDHGEITKVDSPDAYGRIGNQAGSEASAIVLGDYKSDPDAELERPTRVSLIDTRTGELRLVDLPASYTFRSLARGDDGAALVLGTDGQIHVIDPESGELTASIPVIDAWEEPEEWQSPRPSILALDGSVYVTDPATNRVLAVDVPSGEVWQSAELDVTPNELTGVPGEAEHAAGGHDHSDEDEHEGHDH